MAELKGREPVVLAKDFTAMVHWYTQVLGFRVVQLFDQDFHYANLETEAGFKIAIASAQEMGVVPTDPGNNPVVLQFEVDDLRAFMDSLKERGGTILNGPTLDKSGGFWFGGFADLEGNPCWVVDKNCP